ncbi:MAG: glycosyltransferase family 39 protein [Candidatus Omnitrophica bacterium]|nr:glycosyltransferase family 39 protein [Candidatus Omnitrophota bacterium]
MIVFAWAALFFLGLYAQNLVLAQHLLPGMFVYFAVGSLAVLLIAAQKRPAPIAESAAPAIHSSIHSKTRWIQWILGPPLLLSIGAALYFVYTGTEKKYVNPTFHAYALYAWSLFLVLILANVLPVVWKDIRQYPKHALLPLGALLLLSLAAGLYRLADIPPTVHGDEGMVGIYARIILNGKIPTFFSTSWYSIPQLFFFLPACGLYLFGDNLWGLRMETVLIGSFCIIPFYLLVRQWWGTRAAFFAGLLLVANHWFIHLMHCGVNYVQVTFFTITLLALWAYSNARKSLALLILSGAVMGTALLSYQANHLLPILWIISQFWIYLLRKSTLGWLGLSIILPTFIAFLVIAPLLMHDFRFAGETEMFSSRSNAVVIWSPQNRSHLDFAYRAGGDLSLVLREQAEKALFSTILYSDKSIQYNGKKPFLDQFSAVLFVMGVVIAAYRFFEPRWSIPAGWMLGILLVGGALTVDAPFFPRLAGAATLFFIPIAGVLSYFFSVRPPGVKIAYFLACLLAAASCAVNLHYYFHQYPNSTSTKSVHYPQTQMARFILEREPQEFIYVLDGPHFAFNSGTVHFLAPGRQGEDINSLPSFWRNRNCAILVYSGQSHLLPVLKEQFPDYIIREHKTPDGVRMFTSLTKD